MRRWFLIVMAVSFFGCAVTLSEIHSQAPRLSLTSLNAPEQLANCVLYEAKNYKSSLWLVPHMTLVNREGVYYLIMEAVPGNPWAEVSFIPSPDGGSKVEYRVSDVGNCNRVCRFIWDYVEKCK